MTLQLVCDLINHVIKSRNLNLLITNKISDELLISIVKLSIILKIPEDNYYRELGDDPQSILDNSSKILTKCYLGYIEFHRNADNNTIYYERKSKDNAYIQCTCLESSSILDANIICESCELVKSNIINHNNGKLRITHININDIYHKYCHNCCSWRNIKLFNNTKDKWDKLTSLCKLCISRYYIHYIHSHEGSITKTLQNEKDKLSGITKTRNKDNYIKNKTWRLFMAMIDRMSRTDDEIKFIRKYMQLYRSNPSRLKRTKELMDKWLQLNPGYKSNYMKEYRRHRYHTDPIFRVKCILRGTLAKYGKSRGKNYNTNLFGCTDKEYEAHISSLFTDGMSWDNADKWDIDHIIPMAAFDLTNQEEITACTNYINMQPLWHRDNIVKNSYITMELFESRKHTLPISTINRIQNGFNSTQANRIRFVKHNAVAADKWEIDEEYIIEKDIDEKYIEIDESDEYYNQYITESIVRDMGIDDVNKLISCVEHIS